MELTSFTDYSLRVLMYLAAEEGRRSSIDELAEYYQLSRHHVAKIVKRLSDLEYLETTRGKNGGVRLAQAPSEINVGKVIQQTEPHFNLVECLSGTHQSNCVIDGNCVLKGVLTVARGHFFAHIEKYTLADVVRSGATRKALTRSHVD